MDRVLTYRIVSTDTYHAMYRVLEAFSLFNTILSTSQCPKCVSCSLPTHAIHSLGFSRLLVRPRAQAAFHGTPINVVLRCYVLSLVRQRQRLWVAKSGRQQIEVKRTIIRRERRSLPSTEGGPIFRVETPFT